MLLQSGAAFQPKKLSQSGREVVTEWDSFFVIKWDGSCYIVGQALQSETEVVTKWDRCYSGTIITKWALTASLEFLKKFLQYKMGNHFLFTSHLCHPE